MKQLLPIALMLLICMGVMCQNQKREIIWKRIIISGQDTIAIQNGNMDLEKCHTAHGWVDTLTNTEYFEFMAAHIDTIPILNSKWTYPERSKVGNQVFQWTDASKADRGLAFTITPIDTFTPKPLKIKMKPRWRDTPIQELIDTGNGTDVFYVDTSKNRFEIVDWNDGGDFIGIDTTDSTWQSWTTIMAQTDSTESKLERNNKIGKWEISEHPEAAIELLYQYYIQIQKEFMEYKNKRK